MHHPTDRISHTTIFCFTSRGALAGTRNSSMVPPLRIDPTTHCTMGECFYHGAKSRFHVVERLLIMRGSSDQFVLVDQESYSWFSQWHATGTRKGVICTNRVCGMIHIKDILLLTEKSISCSGGSGFSLSLSGSCGQYITVQCVECVVK